MSLCSDVNAASIATVSEITAGHWTFSYKFQHMADQKSSLVDQTYCIFSMEGQ